MVGLVGGVISTGGKLKLLLGGNGMVMGWSAGDIGLGAGSLGVWTAGVDGRCKLPSWSTFTCGMPLSCNSPPKGFELRAARGSNG